MWQLVLIDIVIGPSFRLTLYIFKQLHVDVLHIKFIYNLDISSI